MSGIHPGFMLSVTRLRTVFSDGFGAPKAGTATGFWVSIPIPVHEEFVPGFITNRHNLDPRLNGLGGDFELVESAIELRRHEVEAPCHETRFVKVPPSAWKMHPTADCAAALSIMLEPGPSDYFPASAIG